MLTKLQKRLMERISELQMTPRKVSLAAGLGPDAVRTIMAGSTPRADRLAAIANFLDIDVRYLLGETDDPGSKPAEAQPQQLRPAVSAMLPIRYTVAAGQWRAVDEVFDEEPEYAPVPALRIKGYERWPQWYERVVGSSVNALGIQNGSLIHVVDAIEMGYQPRQDDIVVVVRSRHQGSMIERSVKQVAVGDDGQVQLWGRSTDERYNTPLSYTAGARPGEDIEVQIVGKVLGAYLLLSF